MKNIAILTINDYNNYGNRLQNYAVQEVIKSLGFNAVTVVNTRNVNSNINRSFKDKLQGFINATNRQKYERLRNKIYNSIKKEEVKEVIDLRLKAFKEFTKTYISEYDYVITDNNVPDDLSERFDYFVTGSDQVWNPSFGHATSIDFLTFAPKNKRIAYAPSFGVAMIPDKFVQDMKVWLSEMHGLSVREEAGARIIKELTGRDAAVLVDPTLMIKKEKWLSISKEDSEKPSKRYLLTYFLGDIPKDSRKKIKTIASENSLEIVSLSDLEDKKRYGVDPSRFIDYINSAVILFTNSFHGAVFSILLERPFVVMNRAGMNSRIDTLLSKFKLENRKWDNIINKDNVFNIDFSHIQPILKIERKKALDYLKNALDTKDAN